MIESVVPEIKEGISSGDYCLASGILFVGGALRGAIYDLNTSRVFSINETARQVLTGLAEDEDGFWTKLEDLGLATREKLPQRNVLPELIQKPELQFVWFEVVSDDCNESCAHCYADSMPPSHRKAKSIPAGGYTPLEQSLDKGTKRKKLNVEEWEALIGDAYSLGCRKGQFIGGEPLLFKGENGESVLDLAEFAKEVGYEFIEVFTNATLLTEDKVARTKNLGINVAVSLYSRDESIHDRITNTSGSYKKTVSSLHMLKEAGVPTRVETVLMRPNEQTVDGTQAFVEEMGFSHRSPDVLRPKGGGDNPALTPSKEAVVQYGLMTAPSFTVDKETLSRYLSGHSCLLGKITITDTGDVLPCIFSRNLVVGNALENCLAEIIAGPKLGVVWKNTKDNVLVCKDCEYRYVCFDCRPLSEGVNQGRGEYLSAPYPRCTYNPYTGEWAKGVWRVDEKGEPYYDGSLGPIIQAMLASGSINSMISLGH
ncbi:MAG: Radical SAM domain protein [Candidatus Amesbacteria bacterium GW2011_GWB1_47_26]|uniref:Radical SAM domain protein n=1 Tax=Candidatus Amesbacteria bacterium GW2011_GWC2_45_19 TaxID=1618366 RepID=A0A0G1M3H8_9BACT|nr:MAG: Radical SAM domain protein [Candidatus Amesbacteria bacterium GW2011_GWC2_45_19]KKU37276.1 MAG: Radical SAM domain protein [Candidatus Amesbacteria bacterium GW2011_GWA1_46_35]KKU68381.1 MAG: Radical SAM domain protein [Microgenomates group bacterium GW2011_GWC1_47_20]KKU74455.1 MAG: Radical SAM domain protein [Candidatus Amesbacteria bacterium GW2011_GWB1_47_26]HCX25697.1 hypothetical protein [Candidatus Collierbacteria bacterium]